MHILLFVIFMIAYQCSQAQGFVVTTKGDTIRGEVKPLSYGLDKKVQVTGSDRKKNIYPILQVKAYSFKGEIFQPVKGPSGYTFMKLIKAGYLSLYAYQLENQVTYDGLFMVKKDGTSTEVPNLSFKKIMRNFLDDCGDVATKIDDGTLSKKELNLIVDEYNQCISGRTQDRSQVIARKIEQSKKISAWDVLEEKVKAQSDFSGKSDALEMISEIKNKISRAEKIPNFLIEGLKSSLASADLKTELDNALKEIN
jgi:hypothetical protein